MYVIDVRHMCYIDYVQCLMYNLYMPIVYVIKKVLQNYSTELHKQAKKMIQVTKFCCCCSLRCGAIFVGVVLILVGILDGASASGGLMGWNKQTENYFIKINNLDDFNYIDLIIPSLLQLLLGVLQLLIGISLLVGVFKNKPEFMLPILIMIPVIVAVKWITLLIIRTGLGKILSMAIMSLLYGYIWVCLYSYWKEIKGELDSPVVV